MVGAGYGVEVLYTVLDFAFTVLNLPRVVAETQSANIASCKLLEKL
jgi:[ribosomal protein S5]-alanine N-acetyltransferase